MNTEQPAPVLPRLGWEWRKGAKWLLAQFVVVVLSVLAALALNAWYQGRLDAASEANYLRLLSRDLQSTLHDLEDESAFEALQIADGVAVYRALSAPERPRDTDTLSLAMARLGTRFTMVLKDTTYQDLISTGKLQLIRDAELREQIVKFYQDTQYRFEVINKNNAFFVDDMYNANVIFSGLIMSRPVSNVRRHNPIDQMLKAELASGYLSETDALWKLPAEAPQWAMLKSNIVARLRIAGLAQSVAKDRLQAARELKAAIDAKLAE